MPTQACVACGAFKGSDPAEPSTNSHPRRVSAMPRALNDPAVRGGEEVALRRRVGRVPRAVDAVVEVADACPEVNTSGGGVPAALMKSSLTLIPVQAPVQLPSFVEAEPAPATQ